MQDEVVKKDIAEDMYDVPNEVIEAEFAVVDDEMQFDQETGEVQENVDE